MIALFFDHNIDYLWKKMEITDAPPIFEIAQPTDFIKLMGIATDDTPPSDMMRPRMFSMRFELFDGTPRMVIYRFIGIEER